MSNQQKTEEDTKYNYQEIEKKWQRIWKEKRVFEPNIDVEDKEKYFLTVPYPYTNGPLHIGHGRAFTGGDIYARYKRIRGYNVLFPLAFHITGTPVLATSEGIRSGDPDKLATFRSFIELHVDDPEEVEKILEGFKDPWNVVNHFSSIMQSDFESLGYSIDWTRQFTTGDPEYNKFITWQFTKYKEKNYLTVGELPILYSLDDENAVGEDDIQDGDMKDLSILEYSLMKFPFDDGYLVASTLRPETVFGATNIFVNPKADYVKAKIKKNDEIWYVSKKSLVLLNHQKMETQVLKKFSGTKLLGKFAKNLVDDRKLPVIPGSFVDVEMVTGVVYSVPGHAPFDWIAVKDFLEGKTETYGLEPEEFKKYLQPIKMIDIEKYGERYPAQVACEEHDVKNQSDKISLEEATKQIYSDEFYGGTLNEVCGEFKDLKASEAKEKVASFLRDKNYYGILYSPAEKSLKTRSGGDVIVAIMDNQHFLWFSNPEWKEKAWKALNDVIIHPSGYRKLFENTFNWLDKRPCARKRGLGTRFPFQDEDEDWIIESLSDSTIYMSFYTIKHLINKYKIRENQLTLDFFDYVYLGEGDVTAVSSHTDIKEEYLKKMRKEFLYWYPNDHRHTAIMHISNHLSFFIFAHAAIFPEKHWPKKITLIEPLIRDGEKMGKSKGNVIPLATVAEDYGADLYRLYVANIAELDTVMDWRQKEVDVMSKHLRKVYDYFFDIPVKHAEIKAKSLTIFEKAFLTQFKQHLDQIVTVMKDDALRKYSHEIFFEAYNTIQKYQKLIKNSPQYKSIMSYITDAWTIVASPITPHLCEELWQKRGHNEFVSFAEWPEIKATWIDNTVLAQLKIVEDTIKDIKKIVKALKISKEDIEEVNIILAEQWKYKIYNLAKKLKQKDKLESLIKEAMSNEDIRTTKNTKLIPKYAKRLFKPNITFSAVTQKQEYKLLHVALDYIKEQTGIEDIKIQFAHESESNRAKFAEPTRFAIDVIANDQ